MSAFPPVGEHNSLKVTVSPPGTSLHSPFSPRPLYQGSPSVGSHAAVATAMPYGAAQSMLPLPAQSMSLFEMLTPVSTRSSMAPSTPPDLTGAREPVLPIHPLAPPGHLNLPSLLPPTPPDFIAQRDIIGIGSRAHSQPSLAYPLLESVHVPQPHALVARVAYGPHGSPVVLESPSRGFPFEVTSERAPDTFAAFPAPKGSKQRRNRLNATGGLHRGGTLGARSARDKIRERDIMRYPIQFPVHPVPSEAEVSEAAPEQLNLLPSGPEAIRTRKYATSMDERHYLTVYEFRLNDQAIIWDYFTGYVHLTGLWKALGNAKADIARLVEGSPELEPVVRRVRGGFLKIQGTWVPYEVARAIGIRTCYSVRYALVPMFGPQFPAECLLPSDPSFGQLGSPSQRQRRQRRVSGTSPPTTAVEGNPRVGKAVHTAGVKVLSTPSSASPGLGLQAGEPGEGKSSESSQTVSGATSSSIFATATGHVPRVSSPRTGAASPPQNRANIRSSLTDLSGYSCPLGLGPSPLKHRGLSFGTVRPLLSTRRTLSGVEDQTVAGRRATRGRTLSLPGEAVLRATLQDSGAESPSGAAKVERGLADLALCACGGPEQEPASEWAIDESSTDDDDALPESRRETPPPPAMPRKLSIGADQTEELLKMLQATRALQQLATGVRWSPGQLAGGFQYDGRHFYWNGDAILTEL